MQDTFITFWENKDRFTELNPTKAFLYTSVRNKCLNHLKHKLVKEKHETSLIHELESDTIFTEKVIIEDSFGQLYTEINNLPESPHKIILLSLKGLKNKEIAEKLNISENTVKTQKKIAYSKLREKLGNKMTMIFWFF